MQGCGFKFPGIAHTDKMNEVVTLDKRSAKCNKQQLTEFKQFKAFRHMCFI